MNTLYPWQNDLWQRWIGLRSRLPHALLLKGPQGVGKFDFAMNLARSLLCQSPAANGFACQNCSSCHWFEQETHPDFRLLQPDVLSAPDEEKEGGKKPARQISVDQIRALADFANLSAHQGGHRVVLIHPAETMNTNAANALLKTLEEPSANLLILLVSHKPQQLLPTIRSRCLSLAVTIPPPEIGAAWLQQQGIEQAMSPLAQAGFAPLQAFRQSTENAGAGEFDRLLNAIKQPARLDIYAVAEQLQGTEPALVIHWLQQWCYDLGSAKFTAKVRYSLNSIELLNNLARNIDPYSLIRYQKELMIARREALHPLNARLLYESLLLSYKQMMLGAP